MVSGCSSAWLERSVRDAEVAGSNPVTPTEVLAAVFVISTVRETEQEIFQEVFWRRGSLCRTDLSGIVESNCLEQ